MSSQMRRPGLENLKKRQKNLENNAEKRKENLNLPSS